MGKPVLHAEYLKAWADGQEVEVKRDEHGSCWRDVPKTASLSAFESDMNEFRIKPKTININGFEVPEPVRKPLDSGCEYWYVNHACEHGYGADNWDSNKFHRIRLRNGAVHLTQEAAELHARALLSFTAKQGE
ncbi:hypothetical protein [Alkanindiges illinoisensis]|uniref:hypothetical protein n=1 Tax=Alkanindiges illinoisensis TaxID=197183 RepID=UPI00047B4CC6|nr:hypothetical protein [Alkanindiges illinoisensis]